MSQHVLSAFIHAPVTEIPDRRPKRAVIGWEARVRGKPREHRQDNARVEEDSIPDGTILKETDDA